MHKTIVIAKDFSDDPAGRYHSDGPNSGQRFREEKLLSDLQAGTRLLIVLDGALGYPSSFLEEAFGGLVRECDFTSAELRELIEIEAKGDEYKRYKDAIWRHIDKAETDKKR